MFYFGAEFPEWVWSEEPPGEFVKNLLSWDPLQT